MVASVYEGERRQAVRRPRRHRLHELQRFLHGPSDLVAQRLRAAAMQPLFLLPAYGWTLAARTPTSLVFPPSDPWPGDAAAGQAILAGRFLLAGQELERPQPLWSPPEAERDWCRALHGFDWLRDLRALGGDAARRAARGMVADWLDRHGRWSAPAWEPAVIGTRLSSWLGTYDFFAGSAQIEFRHRLFGVMTRQSRHLARVLPGGLGGGPLLDAIGGLLLAALALPGQERSLARGTALLREALAREVLPDGGHVERSPARQLALLRRLIDLRAACHAAEVEAPPELPDALERAARILRLLRHGDGGLALFNDSGESEGWLLDMVLQRAGSRGPIATAAPDSGFQRLQAGRTLVLVDCASPPPPGADHRAHAGTLSLEVSVGRERLIVNCGAHGGSEDWRRAQRSTAAHSTLCLGGRNSSAIRGCGVFGSRLAKVSSRREEADGQALLEVSHDGYAGLAGLTHRRRLLLAAGGEDLRGEDSLEGGGTADFAIRFHLHPEVSATLSQDGETALLRLPKGGGWRFRARGAALAIEPSVYLGSAGRVRRSQQIVLSGAVSGAGGMVKWALRREAKATKR